MDNKARIVEDRVKQLYETKNPNREVWADWIWPNHVLWVADKAVEMAEAKGLDVSLCRVAALLHDIADVEMSRMDEAHEQRSLQIAREILEEAGYDQMTVDILVNDALAKHSCYDNVRPESDAGRVLATADALAHLQSSFFAYAFWGRGNANKDYEQSKQWAAGKIERDFNNKILFDDIKEQARPSYEALTLIFNA